MEGLQIFENEQFGTVRTVEENGVILFCAVDVANALGYSNGTDAVLRHCRPDGVVFHDLIDNMGRMQTAKFIDEGNLYRLIVHSKLPTAEQFERWVFDEVLPTIRQTGRYASPLQSSGIFPSPYDYINAAKIVASCPNSRLGMVVTLLERSGLDMRAKQVLVVEELDGKRPHGLCKAVGQYDKDGNLIQVFASLMDAERQCHTSRSGICKCCAGKRDMAGGYIWKYIEEGDKANGRTCNDS